MAIYLDGDVAEEMVSLVSGDISGETVYINSPGGHISDMFVILDLLNNGGINELVAVGEVSSAAFFIFIFFKGRKRVMPLTTGMLHTMHRSSVSIKSNGGYSNHLRELLDIQTDASVKFEEEFVRVSTWTDESMPEKFLSGEDVYMSASDLATFASINPYTIYSELLGEGPQLPELPPFSELAIVCGKDCKCKKQKKNEKS